MELVLNLAWLLLAVPAYWLWRRGRSREHTWRGSAECLLALGCALVLLFPVISATDDLHAMRAEMEDSAVSKRAARQSASDKSSAWVNRLQGPPAIVANTAGLPALEIWLLADSVAYIVPQSRPCVLSAGRAPPLSLPV